MTEARSGRTRVLLIDDDEKLNALIGEYLGRFNFAVQAVVHPDEGLRALRLDPPDVVILDVMLPDMDGFAVCRKVRERSSVPIIMLTARGDVADRIVGLELGADDDVAKNFQDRPPGVHVAAPTAEIVADVDPDRMRTVFRNLLENAVKYSLPDSRAVEVSAAQNSARVEIRIRDDGPGIPEGRLSSDCRRQRRATLSIAG